MTGWITLLGLIALAIGALWLMRVRGAMLQACAAALLVGGAGYAVQGRPGLPSAPADSASDRQVVPLSQARHAFFGNFAGEESWLTMSEALARDGDTADSVEILRNAVQRYPGNVQLWIGLGNALVDHAHGLTPPATLAFKRAAALAPDHPGPPFFYGLALARSGDPASAVTLWQKILTTAPPKAGWRPLVAGGITALTGGQPAQAKPSKH